MANSAQHISEVNRSTTCEKQSQDLAISTAQSPQLRSGDTGSKDLKGVD
jgi:hypothetical protein